MTASPLPNTMMLRNNPVTLVSMVPHLSLFPLLPLTGCLYVIYMGTPPMWPLLCLSVCLFVCLFVRFLRPEECRIKRVETRRRPRLFTFTSFWNVCAWILKKNIVAINLEAKRILNCYMTIKFLSLPSKIRCCVLVGNVRGHQRGRNCNATRRY